MHVFRERLSIFVCVLLSLLVLRVGYGIPDHWLSIYFVLGQFLVILDCPAHYSCMIPFFFFQIKIPTIVMNSCNRFLLVY